MKKNIDNIFKSLPELEPSKELKFKVLSKIKLAQQRKLLRQKFALRFLIILSAAGSIGAVAIIGRQIINSDFWSIVQLGFTDFQLVLANWQTYLWSLLETLPAESFVIILLPILILMILSKIYNNQRRFHRFEIIRI